MAKILSFFRVIDEKSQLSITNLSVFAVIGKLIFAQDVTQTDLLALATVLVNYAIKKVIIYFEARTPTPTSVDMTALNETVKRLHGELEDAKSKISGLSLAAGVRSPIPPRR